MRDTAVSLGGVVASPALPVVPGGWQRVAHAYLDAGVDPVAISAARQAASCAPVSWSSSTRPAKDPSSAIARA